MLSSARLLHHKKLNPPMRVAVSESKNTKSHCTSTFHVREKITSTFPLNVKKFVTVLQRTLYAGTFSVTKNPSPGSTSFTHLRNIYDMRMLNRSTR